MGNTATQRDVFARTICAVGGTHGGLEAVRQVERLRPEDGTVVLVTVAETHLAAQAGMQATTAWEQIEAEAQRAVDAALEIAPASSTHIVEGRPTDGVLWAIGEEHATLVACENGHSRAAGMILGSVATAMLHDAPCSVLIARKPRDPAHHPQSIVVGVDGSPESLAAMEAARALSERLGANMQALAATGGKPIDADRLREILPGLVFDDAAPVDALVRASGDADLVVVGSRGLHGIRSLGSVSERVAHRSACTVLAVRSAVRTPNDA